MLPGEQFKYAKMSEEWEHSSSLAVNSTSQKVWAVGGGKGGVGKSLVTANTSICLALMGYKVLAIDLDLGGANLHTCLGVTIPKNTLSDYLSNKVKRVQELVTPTAISNLSIISGAQDEMGMANLRQIHRNRLLSKLSDVNVDIIVFDLGAGTSTNTLDFFLSSDQGILTVLPEPTSIENTYRFIKSIIYRKLCMMDDLLEVKPLIDKYFNSKLDSSTKSPVDLVKDIYDKNEKLGEKLAHEISNVTPKLILNQVRTQSDIDIGFSMKSICKKYFGINLDYIGYLDYDSAVWQSVKKRSPLLMEFPHSKLVNNFDRIVHRLLDLR